MRFHHPHTHAVDAARTGAAVAAAGGSSAESLLASLIAELETALVEGLDADLDAALEQPSQDDVRARREARRQAFKEKLRAEDRAAVAAMSAPVEGDLALRAVAMGLLHPSVLDTPPAPADLLDALAAADRAIAVAEAGRLALVLAVVGRDASPVKSVDGQKAAEIATRLRISNHAAEQLVHRARMLDGPYACFGQALAEGAISYAHCLALIGQTAHVTDPVARETIAAAALPHARRLVVAAFRDAVDALIAELDPDATGRHERAKNDRRVWTRPCSDGMSFLGITHETPVIDAIYAQILADGAGLADQRAHDNDDTPGTHPDADLHPDTTRADALAARVLGEIAEDGTVTYDRAATTTVTVEVVIDLDTLRRLTDRVALVNGRPVPAGIARDLAAAATWWRRMITAPVTGHLLDYGDALYLPPKLRRYVLARDGGCIEPTCTIRAARLLQMDHAEEFPDGPSSADNSHALCGRTHRRKTARLFDITDSRADGSATLTTTWGQTIRIPPRPYLPRTAADLIRDSHHARTDVDHDDEPDW